MEKLVLIDGNSLINRAFYAMPILSTKNGEYTNAVYGFMNMLFKIFSDEKPSHLAVAFDLKAPTFRHEMYSGYKATRKPMPMELRPQIPLLKELLNLMNIRVIEKEGIEADDIIGTVAKHTDVLTYIYTGDRDALQLVDSETEVHFTKRGITEVEIYSNDNFTSKTDLVPLQIIELKALMGDSSDNIPGIPGVGEKTAKTLLSTYKNVENLYNHVDELSGKLKEKVVENKDLCFLSKTLATINTECDVDYSLDSMKVNLPFSSDTKKRFFELEFKSLYTKNEWFVGENPHTAPAIKDVDVTQIKVEDLTLLRNLSGELCVAITEDEVSVYDKKDEYTVKIRKTLLDDGFSLPEVLSAIFSEEKNKQFIVYDKKGLMHLLSDCSLSVPQNTEDVSIIKYLVDFNSKTTNVDELIYEYGKDQKIKAHSLYQIYLDLTKKLIKQQLVSLYRDVELPLVDVLFDMEKTGFKIDLDSLNKTGEELKERLNKTENEIRELVNEPSLNVNSPKQLGEVLFDKLKIGKAKKTKTGYSTNAEILEKYEDAHPSIPKILEYRRIQKLYSTYVEGFRPLIDKNTGLIHTSFNQTVTTTGRLSSKEPNLQNIPVRDEEGKLLRKFFVPRSEDGILIGADYSQIELRLLAAFSNCKTLIDAFNSETDVHSVTASKVFGVKISEVTPSMRRNAKAVNFGIIYGISEYGLAKTLKISPVKAREYINSYFNEYPEVKEYMDKNVALAKERGYAETLLKRRRYIPELLSTNFMMRSFGERASMNMPLQGSSADIIKLAMINVANRLKKENLKSKLILQVHDELIIDAIKKESDKVQEILVEEMQNAVKLSVKLTAEVGLGKNWYEAK
jgi:DNA polymerase-1